MGTEQAAQAEEVVKQRKNWKKLLKDAKEKQFDLLLVYKIDRFSRNLKDLLNLVDELSSSGVDFKFASEPFDTTTSAGKLMFQQLGSFAEFERNRIAERVFPGMVKGVQRGNWQGARYAPYGYIYTKEKKLLEINEAESNVVKLIYTMFLCDKVFAVSLNTLLVKDAEIEKAIYLALSLLATF